MADITNSDRGIDNTCVPSFNPFLEGTTRTSLLSYPSKEHVLRTIQDRKPKIRDSAINLGKIYSILVEKKLIPLRSWAIPDVSGNLVGGPGLSFQIDIAAEEVFGRELDWNQRFQKYKTCYYTVIPEIKQYAVDWAKETLARQEWMLRKLSSDEIDDPKFAGWMHDAAQQISRSSDGFRDRAAEEKYTSQLMNMPDKPVQSQLQKAKKELEEATERHVEAAVKSFIASTTRPNPKDYTPRIPMGVRKKYVELLQIILSVRRHIGILQAYNSSAGEGTRYTVQIVNQAADATKEFANEIAMHPNHVWRYRVMIVGGVIQLGLNDVPGFQEFTLGISEILGESVEEKLVNYLGMSLLIFGLLSGFGAGAVILDAALGVAATYIAYLREHEQELATKSSVFLPDEKKFASSYGYGGTLLDGALTLLAAISLYRPASKLVKTALTKKPPSTNNSLVKGGSVTKEGEVIAHGGITQKSRIATPGDVAQESRSLDKAISPPGAPVKPKLSAPREIPPVKQKELEAADLAVDSEKFKAGERAAKRPTKRAVKRKAITSEASAVEQEVVMTEERAVESRSKGAKQEGASETGGAPKTTERMTTSGTDIPVEESYKETLKQQIKYWEAERAAAQAENNLIQKQIDSLSARMTEARKSEKFAEYNNLLARRKKLIAERVVQPRETISIFNAQIEKYKRLLKGTEAEYIDELTNAARGRREYQEVTRGKLDEIFLPILDTKSVEHIHPRSKIFKTPGFEKLTWDEQVYMFNFKPNLKLMSHRFNGIRKDRLYKSLDPKTWNKYIKNQAGLNKMIKTESYMEELITHLIKNPTDLNSLKNDPSIVEAVIEEMRLTGLTSG